MLQDRPCKISVITVCRNVEKCIAETIESVLGQTYEDIEYVLIDGASTDNTVNIIREYAKEYKIKYVSESAVYGDIIVIKKVIEEARTVVVL